MQSGILFDLTNATLRVGFPLGAAAADRRSRQAKNRTLWQVATAAAADSAEAERYGVLGCLLPLQRHLGGHHALSLGNEVALGAGAVAVLALPLVPLQPGDVAVVAATGTFGPAGPLGGRRHFRSSLLSRVCAISRLCRFLVATPS